MQNNTGKHLEVVDVTASCLCVIGKVERTQIAPGESVVIDLSVDAPSIVEQFRQSVRIQFKSEVIRPQDVLLQAKVIGDVDVSPRSLRFDDADSVKTLTVKASVDGIRLIDAEAVSGILEIQDLVKLSDSKMEVKVIPNISVGQAIEHFRVRYTDESDETGKVRTAETAIGVSSHNDHRFIPSSVLADSESSQRVFLAFSGRYNPADSEIGEVYLQNSEGEYIPLPEEIVAITKKKRRLFELKIDSLKHLAAADSQGLVVKFSDRTVFLPFITLENER